MRLSLWVGLLAAACNGPEGDLQPTLEDRDGDGWYGIEGGGDDCNDDDDRIFPHAPEPCDGVDNNCDNQIDEGATITLYADDDRDGFGTADNQVQGCGATDGWSEEKGDCDDDLSTAFPGATEICDLHDNDCDGSVDELAVDVGDYHPDADADGYGDASEAGIASCDPPLPGYVDDARDCDDTDPLVNPTAIEVCDGHDNDCDGLWNEADPDVVADLVWQYPDLDGDHYGATGSAVDLCWETAGYTQIGGDCDDTDPRVNPGEIETCNSIDDDCDGAIDDDDVVLDGYTLWYVDADGDGYGANEVGTRACLAPVGRVANNDDCDDLDDTIRPSATEVCDDVDNDCDGNVDIDAVDGTQYWLDSDGDGYGAERSDHTYCSDPGSDWIQVGDDCDDTDGEIHPDAAERCNHEDDDCDGQDDAVDPDTPRDETFWRDADRDRYGDVNRSIAACLRPSGYVANADDCDDTDAAQYEYVASYPDEDGDGFGDRSLPSMRCAAVSGFVLNNGDCDDSDASSRPGGTDTWYDGVDGDCDGANDDDQDHDGFTAAAEGGEDCDDTEPTVHPYAYEDETDGIDNDCDGDVDTADLDPRTALVLADDDSQSISFSSLTFPFCGVDYTSIWVGSNGFLTPDYDVDHSEYEPDFLSAPRIAGFWDDLDPEAAGTVEWIEYADAVGVYFRGVEVADSVGETVDFGMILLADGRIVLDYGDVTGKQALVGWSCGPGDGIASDTASWPPTDLVDWTYTAPWDSLGIGMGTEDAFYHRYTGGITAAFDMPRRSLIFCVSAGTDDDGDGWTDACGDPDDGDASVTPL